MPHHNVTLQPQCQTTNPRDTQVNDLSHLVRGEHCLPNNQGMTWVWAAGHLLRSISFEIPRLTAYVAYTANRAKYYEQGQIWWLEGPLPSSVKRLRQGNACVGVRREVEAIPTYMSHQWYTTLVLEPWRPIFVLATVQWSLNGIRSSGIPFPNVDNFLKGLSLHSEVSE